MFSGSKCTDERLNFYVELVFPTINKRRSLCIKGIQPLKRILGRSCSRVLPDSGFLQINLFPNRLRIEENLFQDPNIRLV